MKKLLFSASSLLALIAPNIAYADPVTLVTTAITFATTWGLGIEVLSLSAFESALVISAATAALGFISSALTPKPKLPTLSDVSTGNRSRQLRQPVTSRKIIYGEAKVSGAVVLAETTDQNNKLHLIIVLAGHEVEAIDEVFFNEVPIYESQIDQTTRIVNNGLYARRVRIKKHLGADDQAADSDLVTEVSAWTTDHRLRGIAYLYVRLTFNVNAFPTGIPNISAYVRGKKVTEIRDSAQPSQFSVNPSLIIRDYLLTSEIDMGVGATESELDDTVFLDAANTSDEMVSALGTGLGHSVSAVDTTNDLLELDGDILQLQRGDQVSVSSPNSLPTGLSSTMYVIPNRRYTSSYSGYDDITLAIQLADTYDDAIAGNAVDISSSGTLPITILLTAEPRYTANGVIDSSDSPRSIMDDLLTSLGGRLTNIGGTWRLFAAEYLTPTVSFDESDIIDVVTVQTKHSRRERFNTVSGFFVSPVNLGVQKDYPTVKNSLYKSEDKDITINRQLDLPFTSRTIQSQRLAKIELERHRQQISASIKTSLKNGLRTHAGRVINISLDRFGWDTKPFEVIDWQLTSITNGDAPVFAVEMALRETASGVFDWANGEETTYDLAPNTNLPSPFSVPGISGLNISTSTIINDSTGIQYAIKVNWNRVNHAFVANDGHISVEYRESDQIEDLTAQALTWAASSYGTNEYYLESNIFHDPSMIVLNGTPASKGTLGSLAAGEFGYGNNDDLGFKAIYVRMSDDSNPADSANTVEAEFYTPLGLLAGEETDTLIRSVEFGKQYDVRVGAINYLGVAGVYTELTDYAIGTAKTGTSGLEDLGFVFNGASSTEDLGLVVDSVTETEDLGSV